MRVVLCLLALVAVANAASKINTLKKVLSAGETNDDFTTAAGCVAVGGRCEKVVGCTGAGTSIVRNLCPGDSSFSCCVRKNPSVPSPLPINPPGPAPVSVAALAALADMPLFAACTKANWADRGSAPNSYTKGMIATFAKTVCEPSRSDAALVGNINKGGNDALAWYADKLVPVVGNPAAGLTTVRQLFALLIGLGMRESSGVYCTGRDMSANFASPDTAEAGLFQTSWGAHTRSAELDKLFAKYSASRKGCLFSTFAGSLKCSTSNLKNWGNEDTTGFKFQKLTKECPAFAAEYAAVLLRLNGGAKGEWGPLRQKKAQVNKTCFDLLGAAQTYVTANPSVCALLNA